MHSECWRRHGAAAANSRLRVLADVGPFFLRLFVGLRVSCLAERWELCIQVPRRLLRDTHTMPLPCRNTYTRSRRKLVHVCPARADVPSPRRRVEQVHRFVAENLGMQPHVASLVTPYAVISGMSKFPSRRVAVIRSVKRCRLYASSYLIQSEHRFPSIDVCQSLHVIASGSRPPCGNWNPNARHVEISGGL